MKCPVIAAMISACLPVVGVSAPGDAVLVKAESIRWEQGSSFVASGRVQVTTGAARVAADQVSVDHPAGTAKFSGAVVVHIAGSTFEAKELTLDIAGKRFFALANGNVTSMDGRTVVTGSDGKVRVLEFSEAFPKTATELSR